MSGEKDHKFSQFAITVKDGTICKIFANCSWLNERLEGAFLLGFTYSDVVLLQDVTDQKNRTTRYALRFFNDSGMVNKFLDHVLKYEQGWTIKNNTIYSPDNSNLDKTVEDLILQIALQKEG